MRTGAKDDPAGYIVARHDLVGATSGTFPSADAVLSSKTWPCARLEVAAVPTVSAGGRAKREGQVQNWAFTSRHAREGRNGATIGAAHRPFATTAVVKTVENSRQRRRRRIGTSVNSRGDVVVGVTSGSVVGVRLGHACHSARTRPDCRRCDCPRNPTAANAFRSLYGQGYPRCFGRALRGPDTVPRYPPSGRRPSTSGRACAGTDGFTTAPNGATFDGSSRPMGTLAKSRNFTVKV